jgi:hypothetical protein
MARVNPPDDKLQAIEVFKKVIIDPGTRQQYAKAKSSGSKKAVFDKKRDGIAAAYDDIPLTVRTHLENCTDEQLQFLADLDAAFVAAGLSVETNPVPLMVH